MLSPYQSQFVFLQLLTPLKKLQLNGKMKEKMNVYSVNVVATEDEENQVSAKLNLDTKAQTVDMKAFFSPSEYNLSVRQCPFYSFRTTWRNLIHLLLTIMMRQINISIYYTAQTNVSPYFLILLTPIVYNLIPLSHTGICILSQK